MEKSRLTNFLRVMTSVTTSEGHSVVRMKTPLMQTYWVTQFPRMYSHILGTENRPSTERGSACMQEMFVPPFLESANSPCT